MATVSEIFVPVFFLVFIFVFFSDSGSQTTTGIVRTTSSDPLTSGIVFFVRRKCGNVLRNFFDFQDFEEIWGFSSFLGRFSGIFRV